VILLSLCLTASADISAVLWYVGRANKGEFGNIRLPADESARLMSDHVPATLHFKDIAYTLPSAMGSSSPAKPILAQISGKVGPGQVLAIMGASGAGKSTFLDILARKPKRGTVTGTTSVNGREVPDDQFRRVCGFVDQEDTLMRTLTVYETVLYSALLRLPREMSNEAKKYRVMETLNELGIMSIKDSRIGDSSNRGISGGEKRRVSIACELVTSPSILFLDEPTSGWCLFFINTAYVTKYIVLGLDAYNAFNVIDSLVSLARNYQRTVVFTIHQPRSNIVSLFDQLLVLAQGRVVYSGEFAKTHAYLDSIGHPCPPGFNIADFLIDLTSMPPTDGSDADADVDDSIPRSPTATATDDGNIRDEERGLLRPFVATRASSSNTSDAEETELRTRNRQNRTSNQSTAASVMGSIRKRTSRLFSSGAEASSALPPFLAELVEAFAKSELARELDASAANGHGNGNGVLPDVEVETNLLKGRKRASLWTQFRILSGRAFKNLYRDPALLATHYIASFVLAREFVQIVSYRAER
jgi:ABC-type multidrug transport system ATPase subunit